VLLVNNEIAANALTMPAALSAIESAFRQVAEGQAIYQPRTDLWSPTATVGDYYRWGSLLGAITDPPILAFRFKSDVMLWQEYKGAVTEENYYMKPGTYCGLILLIDTRTGELLCLINDGYLQSFRVGATAGVGAKYLSRKDSSTLGVLGSGAMARTYAMAISSVRTIKHIKVFSPTEDHRNKYASLMRKKLGIEVDPVNAPDDAIDGVDIVATCTDSRVPIFRADWLKPGMHIVDLRPEEMDEATYSKADLLIATSNNAVLEYIIGTEEQRRRMPRDSYYLRRYKEKNYTTLPEIIVGSKPARILDDQMTLHHNFSAGIQFAALGYLVYRYAKDNNLGRELPGDWFQQDIRD
jgi:alanine dehydrogenase